MEILASLNEKECILASLHVLLHVNLRFFYAYR